MSWPMRSASPAADVFDVLDVLVKPLLVYPMPPKHPNPRS